MSLKQISFKEAPILSLRDYKEGGGSSKTEFLYGLQKSWDSRYGGQGFAKFIQTSVDLHLLKDIHKYSKIFFQTLSNKEKEEYNLHCRGQRGYTGFGIEGAKDQNIGDLKEMLMWGRDSPDEPNNIDPFQVPHLKNISLSLYEKIEEDNKIFYYALAEILDINPAYFTSDWSKGRIPNSSLRTIYYPPVSNDLINGLQKQSKTNDVPMRSAEHGDINRITWLYLAESSQGLQIKQHDNSWEDANVEKEIAIVNVGDILSTETDGVLRSAIHRVIVIDPDRERYSFPFFTHPAKGKYLKRLLSHPKFPGQVYRNAFAETYRSRKSHHNDKSILDKLQPEILEILGESCLRIKYDNFLERRLADIGVFSDNTLLEEKTLHAFANRIPQHAEREDWETEKANLY